MEKLLVGIIGLCVGSFLNVLADRLPVGETIWWGRSHCDFCKKTLRWYELVPLLSYLVQDGRCRRCHKKLSVQYPIVELITGLGFVFLYPSIPMMVLFSAFLVIFVADLKFQIIPDSMVVISSLAALFFHIGAGQPIIPFLLPALLSALFFYILWAVTRGRGMGFGDVKLAPVIGLFLGYPGTVIALYIAFLTGAIVGVILIFRRRVSWKSHIAFGPFLVLGTALTYMYSRELIAFWNMVL